MKLNDPGRTPSDTVAKAHDIDYSLAKDVSDVRNADIRMLKSLARIKEQGLDSRFNTIQGEKLIKAKVKLEDLGVDPKTFTSFGNKSPEQIELLKAERAKLEQQGYGKKRVAKKLPPGLKLKRKLLAKHRDSKKNADDMTKAVRAIMTQLKV